ncbi:restriction endonuclease subunit S [Paenibacillus alvei]|uniref:restriction endonuclease subunit S n=1 Tax=Paenibacillus alvei TaxID=44250 RepID=UPI00227FFE97|nr:restriction endonuclease subunit S [Paenibacillus alvei]MCY7487469.1 restriction endonuclease subunit S [Paenibacillus alvei]
MKVQQYRLGNVATYINGYAFKPNEWDSKGLPIIRIQNLTGTSSLYNYYDGEIPDKYIVEKDDILISWSASLGVYRWNGERALLNQHIFKVEFNKIDIDKYYFMHIIGHVLRNVENFIHGSTMKHITKKDFDQLVVPVPSLNKQKKIAAVLDRAQALIDKRKKAITKLDEFIQAVFLDMFGDPILNNKGLSKVKLGDIGKWQSGGTPLRAQPEYYTNGTFPWYTSGELNQTFICESQEYITGKAIVETSVKKVEAGSLMLGMYDSAALKSSITTCEATCNQAIAFSKLDERKVVPLFVFYNIQLGKEYYKSQQRGVRQKNLNLSMIKNIEILYPSLDMQRNFEIAVSKMNRLKKKMQQSLTQLETNFNALLQRAFKGELTSSTDFEE